MTNSKNGTWSIKLMLIFAAILVLGITWISTSGKATTETSICKDNAKSLLQKEDAKYSFSRCEQETLTTNDGKTLTRVKAVAGEIAERWEQECGYIGACSIHVGWFDENNNIIDFVDAPDVANHDPAVYTLGCGEPNSSSIFDTEIKPTLVFENDKYWWKTSYDNTIVNDVDRSEVASPQQICEVSGVSMVRKAEVLSSVKANYKLPEAACELSKSTNCQTHNALRDNSSSRCQDIKFTDRKAFDYGCVRNFIAQTGDKELCGITTSYGFKVECDQIPIIKPLD